MSMSFTCFDSNDDKQYFQGVWARMFGHFIQSGREKAGLPIEAAAWFANLDDQQWSAMESGDLLPTTREQLQLVASALDIPWDTMSRMIVMCRQAWGIQ